jgi:hypothetical protein
MARTPSPGTGPTSGGRPTPKVEIEHLAWQGEELRLVIRLDVRKPDGSRARQPLANTLSFAGELIRAMRIA